MMRSRHTATLLVMLATSLGAQGKSKTARCTISSRAAWVERQAAFFDDSKHEWSNDSLRTALLEAAGLQGPLVAPVQDGIRIDGKSTTLGPSGAATIDHLKKLAATRGSVWPTRSVVGAAGTHAVYMLARTDTALGRAALHRMMEAGPAESPAADVAVLEDQMRMTWGRKQIYGTQFLSNRDAMIVLAPMEDSAHADLRREDASLPPLALASCLARNAR